MEKKKRRDGCYLGSCYEYEQAQKRPTIPAPDCAACGFYADEDKRRQGLPLTIGPDGLRRKCVGAAMEAQAEEEEDG
jgi:hypothetical protein